MVAQRQPLRQRERVAVAGGIDDRECAGRICNDVRERIAGEPDIERQRNGAGAHRAKEEFDELGAVADQHGDALARPHAEPRQHARNSVHTGIELAIGREALAAAPQIDDCHLVRHARDGVVEEEAEIALTIETGGGHTETD